MRRSRKADLSLSTNAIVVMIIAITILGLALGFTRNIFGRLGGQIDKIGQQTIVDNPPSYEKPLTLNNEALELRLGGSSEELGIGVFNKYDSERSISLRLDTCTFSDSDGNIEEGKEGDFSFLISGAKTVPVNEAYGFSAKVGPKKDMARKGEYLCTLAMETDMGEYEYKDFSITVK